MRQIRRISILIVMVSLLLFPLSYVHAWPNGPDGNKKTDTAAECLRPPYGTHDWIANNALEKLPDNEKEWLAEYKSFFLLGTEAPDNKLPVACSVPGNGIGDTSDGHSVKWATDWSHLEIKQSATRAQEEYENAVNAYKDKQYKDAAYYLGAMSHYIGDVTSYPHTVPNDKYHSKYENWVNRKITSSKQNVFAKFIDEEGTIEKRTPSEAVENISKTVARGEGKILSAKKMDALYGQQKMNSKGFVESTGHSLALGVNELADVLHTFYQEEVENKND